MGKKPKICCSGGTSDGRCVAETDAEIDELGPKFETIHKIDEKIEIAFEKIKNHPFLISNPIQSKNVALFRIKLLGLD